MIPVILKNTVNLIWREKHKIGKPSKLITQQSKTLEKPDIADIKSVITEHPKTSHKLSKTIRQAEKVSQVSGADKNSDSSLYGKIKKVKVFWMEKMQK